MEPLDQRVLSWLSSIDSAADTSIAATTSERNRERKRKRAASAIISPPESVAAAAMSSTKRQRPHQDADLETTPRPSRFQPTQTQLIPVRFGPRPSSSSPKRRWIAARTVKDTDGLSQLDKPIFVQHPSKRPKDVLSEDVWDLFDDVTKSAVYHEAVLPWELHEILEHELQTRPTAFAPRPSYAEAVVRSEAQAEKEQEYKALQKIHRRAALSAAKHRYEDAWGLEVVGPMLELAFGTEETDAEDHQLVAELLASATISEEYVPRMRQLPNEWPGPNPPSIDKDKDKDNDDGDVSIIACSLSEASTTSSTSVRADRDRHTKSGSKKVDFGVVVVPGRNTALRASVEQRTALGREGEESINQTAYLAVRHSPLAVSIELKRKLQTRDPLVQGGIWLAAQHRRLSALHYTPQSLAKRKIITLPFIVVTEHQWEMYLLQDEGARMVMYGPVRMGGTDDFLELYVLLETLRALGRWIRGRFIPWMEEWLRG